MIWYEVIEDLGDGSSRVLRFRTEEKAEAFQKNNEEWCYSGVTKQNTEQPYFFYED